LEAWIAAHIVPFLENLFGAMGWAGVVAIMALESANIPIPSEVTMPLAGWLLLPKAQYSAWQAFLIAGGWGGLGCLIGSLLSYVLGYFGGRPLVEKYGNYILVREHDLARFDAWFARWGDAVSFVSRLLPIVRTFVSFPSGMFKIPLLRFSVYTFVGSFLWCGALSLVGWAWGDHWELILSKMGPFKYVVAAAIVVGLIWYVWRHVRPESRRPQDSVQGSD
jgi:membrane protein DedA with SNARE-associated domain